MRLHAQRGGEVAHIGVRAGEQRPTRRVERAVGRVAGEALRVVARGIERDEHEAHAGLQGGDPFELGHGERTGRRAVRVDHREEHRGAAQALERARRPGLIAPTALEIVDGECVAVARGGARRVMRHGVAARRTAEGREREKYEEREQRQPRGRETSSVHHAITVAAAQRKPTVEVVDRAPSPARTAVRRNAG